jgi:hypothetical protein
MGSQKENLSQPSIKEVNTLLLRPTRRKITSLALLHVIRSWKPKFSKQLHTQRYGCYLTYHLTFH